MKKYTAFSLRKCFQRTRMSCPQESGSVGFRAHNRLDSWSVALAAGTVTRITSKRRKGWRKRLRTSLNHGNTGRSKGALQGVLTDRLHRPERPRSRPSPRDAAEPPYRNVAHLQAEARGPTAGQDHGVAPARPQRRAHRRDIRLNGGARTASISVP